MLLFLSLPAAANIAPPELRPLIYNLTIDNLADYPDHVLLVYPTHVPGQAYVFENKTELGAMMTRDGFEGGSALYAMARADFDAHAPSPASSRHGEDVWLTHVPPPPDAALRAALDVRPLEWVWEQQTERELVRTVHIDTLSAEAFVLQLVHEETLHSESGSEETLDLRSLSPSSTLAPKQTRCATAGSAGGLLTLALALIGLSRRRETTS